MSLKCSLFGHRYGDSEVRRDREQDGSELVETIQEVKLCDRCGEQLVISETTEVTTVEAASDGETDTDAGSDDTAPAAGESPETPRGAGNTSNSAGDAGSTPAGTSQTATGSGDTPGGPRGGDSAGTDGRDGPDPSEQEMPPTRKDDAVLIDEEGEEQPMTEWPQNGANGANDQQRPEWEPETELTTEGRPEQPTRSSSGLTVPEGEFHCSECGFSTAVESSSLREGDFCPECHRGALEHHTG
jgi:hypothetical protein